MEKQIEVEIVFPQIVFERKTITVSEKEYDAISGRYGKGVSDFIWRHMSESEQEQTFGEKMVSDLCDICACYVKVKT